MKDSKPNRIFNPMIAIFATCIVVIALSGNVHSATCTPTGNATVCGVADDYMTIYINGVAVGGANVFRFAHVNYPTEGPAWGVANPVCVSVSAASLNLTATGNVIAARVQNQTGHEAFGSWTVDIDCG
jgi:hypothetical protein